MKSTIDGSQISVVIQGPVRVSTKALITSVRSLLPGAEIILSTWNSENVSGLDYDYLVLSEAPKAFVQHKRTQTKNNLNRLIRSTIVGIKKASRDYILKIRSDIILESTDFLESYDLYPKRTEYTVLKRKIVVPLLFSRISYKSQQTPFHLSDWAAFGLAEDIHTVFANLQEVDEPLFTEWFKHSKKKSPYGSTTFRFSPEQYIFYTFYHNNFQNITMNDASDNSDNENDESSKFIVSNFIIVDFKRSGFRLNKYPASIDEITLGREYLFLWNRFNYESAYKLYCDKGFSIQKTTRNNIDIKKEIDKAQLLKHYNRFKKSKTLCKKVEEIGIIAFLCVKMVINR